jgi:hypothetical protein
MPISDWRSSDTIEQLNRLERSGFAVEFLRRNHAYRADYARIEQLIAHGWMDPDAARANLARRWGLRFRPRS